MGSLQNSYLILITEKKTRAEPPREGAVPSQFLGHSEPPQRQVAKLLGPALQQCAVLTTFLLAINQVTESSRERFCGLLYTLG